MKKETQLLENGYVFARKSRTPNIGEDILGSRRHKANKVRKVVRPEITAFLFGTGIRAVQWGNYVTDKERPEHLRKLAESFQDIAVVLGLPTEFIGLNGLGLAVGARGNGKSAAHYEPEQNTINVTRKNGIDTLAHEWAHALDRFLGGGKEYASQIFCGDVRITILQSSFHDRLPGTLSQRGIRGARRRYYLSAVELFARCFEVYLADKLEAAGIENAYLCKVDKDGGVYPTREEMKEIAPAFDEMIESLHKHFEPREKPVIESIPAPVSKMTALDAAYEVLKELRGATTIKELTAMILEKGLWVPKGQKPESTIAGVMSRAISKGDPRFVRVGNGHYRKNS